MVDRVLIERILADIFTNVQELKSAEDISWEIYQKDTRSRRFVERTLHVIIEGVLDVGQHIIADEKFREPDSYRDIFKVLTEYNVLSPDNLSIYEKMASFRNLIVHYYEKIDDEVVFGVFKKNLADIELFISEITDYLKRNR